MTGITRSYLINLTLLILALLLSVAIGAVFIPPGTILRMLGEQFAHTTSAQGYPQSFKVILYEIRFPHTVLIALTGAALGSSGAAYQGLFRNPLADPYLIGVASGAGLGAVIALSLAWPMAVPGYLAVPAAAFLGGITTVTIVYLLARTRQALPTTTLILAGVAVGSFASALTSFLMLRSEGEVRRALAWLLGGSTLSGWSPVYASLPYLTLGITGLLISGHALNVLQYGDEQAQQLGLNVDQIKKIVILAASLTTATAVSFAGVIGFIGLIVPHLMRIIWGSDYRHLIPLSLLGGATLLLCADVLARVVLAPQELPVGVITALTGAPFFLWILRRYQRDTPRA